MRATTTLIVSIVLTTIGRNSAQLPTGAVVTNGHNCGKIGAAILDLGGSAVDAAIASLFCEGVSVPQALGLGGGFIMTIYMKETGTAVTLNSREVAPAAASQDMFHGDETLAVSGGLAVAVPAELKGYWEAYNKYGGKVPWKDLVQPTIDLCNNGILVTENMEKVLASVIDTVMNDDLLRETYIDPKTNKTYVQNQYIRRPRLAKFLGVVADLGADALYNGVLTDAFVQDIQDKGGIITREDLNNYEPQWLTPVKVQMPFDQTLYAPPLPTSGVILGLILNILNGYLDYSQPESTTNWQRIVESFKYGFAKRTELGDPAFVEMDAILANLTSTTYAEGIRSSIFDDQTFQDPAHYGANITQQPDHGTGNICVLAPNGDAVAVTSTINLNFGARFMSNSTGIILNDQMDDFSSPGFINSFGVPPSPSNFIEPGKRPVSSMCPSVVVDDDGDVILVVGGAGGTQIITSVALTIIKNLWFNFTIHDAVADKRLHHQLYPMWIEFEDTYSDELVNALHEIGHEYKMVSLGMGFNAVTSISCENGTIEGTFDPRRGGDEAYVYIN
jgi:gamma-glutamyltranspeptidase/glutathione hydrolase/leukotriene-C4 hydrolase